MTEVKEKSEEMETKPTAEEGAPSEVEEKPTELAPEATTNGDTDKTEDENVDVPSSSS